MSEKELVEVKRLDTGEVIHSGNFSSVKECLENGIKKGISFFRANLEGANLRGANLRGANLEEANLQGASLQRAYLLGANLEGAYLQGADLLGAYLRGANLRGAYLQGADLQEANLRGADLRGAYLQRAELLGADLLGAIRNGEKIKHFASWLNLYKYVVEAQICESGKLLVRMGCYTRTVEGWEADFWNNDNEFPNDGSLYSIDRLNAYAFAKKWIENRTEKDN